MNIAFRAVSTARALCLPIDHAHARASIRNRAAKSVPD